MNSAYAFRLVYALTGAGFLLLALEIVFPGMAMAVIGGLALLGATGVAYYGCGIDVGSILLLIITTLGSLGYLIVLVYFPKSPLAKGFFQRAAIRAVEHPFDDLKGVTGESITLLQPAGVARFMGFYPEEVNVIAEGGMIEPGVDVIVVRVRGQVVFVQRK